MEFVLSNPVAPSQLIIKETISEEFPMPWELLDKCLMDEVRFTGESLNNALLFLERKANEHLNNAEFTEKKWMVKLVPRDNKNNQLLNYSAKGINFNKCIGEMALKYDFDIVFSNYRK